MNLKESAGVKLERAQIAIIRWLNAHDFVADYHYCSRIHIYYPTGAKRRKGQYVGDVESFWQGNPENFHFRLLVFGEQFADIAERIRSGIEDDLDIEIEAELRSLLAYKRPFHSYYGD